MHGFIELSWWQLVVVTLAVTHITIAAVTIFLHRTQAHRALDLHPLVSHFFRAWLWLTTGMVTREWVAVHRKHHARCEAEEDPHSPQVKGLARVLFGGVWLYHEAANDPETLQQYGRGTPDDWLERHLYARFPLLGVGLTLLLDLLLFGLAGVLVWGVQMIWIPWWAAGVINGIGHYWGYRNYESNDASTNILPFGLLIGGEELHNNHHAFPNSARLSNKWWEIDLGWLYIRSLAILRLAKVNKVAPRPHFIRSKEVVDVDTLKAVVANRMHVLASYAKDVMLPVGKSELCRSATSCKKVYRQTKNLLIREESRLDEAARKRLRNILEQSQALQTVYQYRTQLRELWERRSLSQEALLGALQEWCREAESTGIKALEEFSRGLRHYSLKGV